VQVTGNSSTNERQILIHGDWKMAENGNFQMAIDMLCCHLGLSEDEAKEQLGICGDEHAQKRVMETQSALLGLVQDK